jgi:hypothetical protein
VHLALGGARADRAPGHQVADVLRRDGVEELAARRHAGLVDAQQQVARHAQALVDAEAAVQVRVVDQALPAHRGARLLEIHPHQDFQVVGVPLAFFMQFFRIFQRGDRIMDRAWPDDHQQPVGLAVQDLAQLAPRVGDQRLHRGTLDREEADQVLGRRQRDDVLDALVVGQRSLVVDRLGHGVGLGRCTKKNRQAFGWRFLGSFVRAELSRSLPPDGRGSRRRNRNTGASCGPFNHRAEGFGK